MRALILIALILLTGCTKGLVRQPAPEVLRVPEVRYVPIEAKYTPRCEWVANGGISDIFDVARGRKYCLEIYEAAFEVIRKIQGTQQ